MTEPKSFKRGRRTYTRVGAHKEVRIEHGDKPEPPAPPVTFEAGAEGTEPIYANAAAVHRSPDEVVLDLAFAGPGRLTPKIRSRVAMSPRLAAKLSALLAKAAKED